MCEYYLCALALKVDSDHELVATAKRKLVFNSDFRYHRIDAILVQLSKVDAQGFKELMARMLHIMLIVGVVHDSLKVALIIAHLHLVGKYVVFWGHVVLCLRV